MSAAAEFRSNLEDANAAFEPLFLKAPVGVAQCQSQGRVTALNPALERMLGKTAESILHLDDLVYAADRSECQRLIAELLNGRRDSFQIESKIGKDPEGVVQWTVWRVFGKHNANAQILALAEPISFLSSTQNRIQIHRLETVGRLAGGVAHDFNNLLTGVLLYCDLLLGTLEPGHRARKYAEEIRKASLQATGVVRQLLAMAKPASSDSRLLSLNEIAEGMGNLLTRLVGENIQLKFRLDPHLGLVKIDPAHVQQILLNLVLNARDAMPGGGEIDIQTSDCKVQILPNGSMPGSTAFLPCALLTVGDNGSGMDLSTKSRLFEPFFTTKGGNGTGLGLATVHDIVTSNGGLIHVDSEIGQGTRFHVLLPIGTPVHADSIGDKNFHPAKNGEVLSLKEEE